MYFYDWISNNYIEVFGAVAGILYVLLEIRQNIWLWPVGIITSGVYIWIFFTGKLYADMSLQGYYLVISVLGWYWWLRGAGRAAQGTGHRARSAGHGDKDSFFEEGLGDVKTERRRDLETEESGSGSTKFRKAELKVSRLKLRTGIVLSIVFALLFSIMWSVLDNFTDSPVPEWDSFITSLSIIATWMLARKIYEHWFLWIIVNTVASGLFFMRGLYPTVALYIVYCGMSFVGLFAWKKPLNDNNN
jgi:nicotinamide mononucleotide transporter